MQTWFTEFPGYKPKNDKVSIATESYRGRYGPAFMAFCREQNDKIRRGIWRKKGQPHILNLDSLILVNGLVDRLIQAPSFVTMAYNNTYGIQAYDASVYESVQDALYRKGGCLDIIRDCHRVSRAGDPTN